MRRARLTRCWGITLAGVADRAGEIHRAAFRVPHAPGLSALIENAVRRIGGPPLLLYGGDANAPGIVLNPGPGLPEGRVAVPRCAAVAVRTPFTGPPLSGMEDAEAAALDTLKFFGHIPGSSRAPMPGPSDVVPGGSCCRNTEGFTTSSRPRRRAGSTPGWRFVPSW